LQARPLPGNGPAATPASPARVLDHARAERPGVQTFGSLLNDPA
jgi:hypothetical protein